MEPAPSIDIPVGQVTSAAYNVMAAPSSVPSANSTVRSNVSDPGPPAASAAWGNRPLPALIDQNYRGSPLSEEQLPKFTFNIANSSVEDSQLATLCDQQRKFCATAGCEDGDDEVSHNLCDEKNGMAVMCTCKKSRSRLAQYEWPVQMNDCLMRVQRCQDTCNNGRKTPFMQRAQCTQACADHIGSSCGKPVQYGVNYAVSKPGQTPNYQLVDQSEPRSADAHLSAPLLHVLFVAAAAAYLVSPVSL